VRRHHRDRRETVAIDASLQAALEEETPRWRLAILEILWRGLFPVLAPGVASVVQKEGMVEEKDVRESE
jgi:hypothetical protein